MISDIIAKAIEDITEEVNTHPEIYGGETPQYIIEAFSQSLRVNETFFRSVEDGYEFVKKTVKEATSGQTG